MTDRTWVKTGKSLFVNIVLLTRGSCLSALSINGILIPNPFPSGGITGLSLLLHYEFPESPFVLFYLMFNIPLFAVAWRYVSRVPSFPSLASEFARSLHKNHKIIAHHPDLREHSPDVP